MKFATIDRATADGQVRVEDALTRIIPFSSQVADGVVLTRQGYYVMTFRIEGLPFEGMSDDELDTELNALNLLVRSMSNGKFAFWVHRVRRQVRDALSLPPSGYARDLMVRYYDSLAKGGLLATELYLTVLYRPNAQPKGQLFGKKSRTESEIRSETVQALDVLGNVERQVGDTLRDYRPKRLCNYEVDGSRFSELLEFYAFLVNGRWWRIPAKEVPASGYIGLSRLLFGNELVELRDTYGSSFQAFVDLKDYSDFTNPGTLTTLGALPFEYVETHSFAPMALPDAVTALKRQKGQLLSSQDVSVSQIAQIDQALDALAAGKFSFGQYHYSLAVKGNTPEAAKDARSKAIEALQQYEFLGVPLDLIPSYAFAAQLPGNFALRARTADISSVNFAGLCSFHNFSAGKRTGNPWGEAVAIFKTPANQPLYFNFHDTPLDVESFGLPELGHTQIVGKSRGGKTVVALFTVANLMRFGTQVVYFDKDRGAEIGIRRMGGHYLTLERGKPTGLSPFKMEPTDATQLFWIDLLRYCSQQEGRPHTPTDIAEIEQAVRSVANLPREARSFKILLQSLPFTSADCVAARLTKWAKGGTFGWALDSDEDTLDFTAAQIVGLDYTQILEDGMACPPIMMYLMHRLDLIMDGRRLAFYIDEYWKALQNEYFLKFAQNTQKTGGKKEAFGVYITQSPSDTVASPIARTLIEQSATLIFLPNPAARRVDYVDGFGVSESVYQLILSLSVSSRMFVIKQGETVRVAKLDLAGFTDDLRTLSATAYSVRQVERLREQYGDDPDDWVGPFLRGEGAPPASSPSNAP